jgi:hypothetical protein
VKKTKIRKFKQEDEKVKISEAQIIAALKEHEAGKTARISAAGLVSTRLHFTKGRRRSIRAWIPKNFAG